jgi:hypothetical protein
MKREDLQEGKRETIDQVVVFQTPDRSKPDLPGDSLTCQVFLNLTGLINLSTGLGMAFLLWMTQDKLTMT